MAFNFLGTINSLEDFEELEEFVNKEFMNIDKRILHMDVEKQRYQELLDKFLISDLELRSPFSKADLPDKDWIIKPRQATPILRNKPDSLNGEDVNLLKKMFLDSIKAKRERNEFKVKKIRDLIDQMTDEINFLTEEQDNYLDALDRIRSRFYLDQYSEVQAVAKEDAEDVKRMRKNFGVKETATTKEYMVKAINTVNNSIIFERSVPSVKKGSTFTLKNGKNDGLKTVVGFLSVKSVVVAEPLTQETPSQSLAVFSKV